MLLERQQAGVKFLLVHPAGAPSTQFDGVGNLAEAALSYDGSADFLKPYDVDVYFVALVFGHEDPGVHLGKERGRLVEAVNRFGVRHASVLPQVLVMSK